MNSSFTLYRYSRKHAIFSFPLMIQDLFEARIIVFLLSSRPFPFPFCLSFFLVSTQPGSRRPSLASVHSTTSSVRSYSMRRFEQEIQQKELRQEMKKHLVRLQEQQQLQKIKPNIIIGDVISCPMNKPILTTPSPMTPNSIDDLLPSVDETQEVGVVYDMIRDKQT